jgi:hypothetical protein
MQDTMAKDRSVHRSPGRAGRVGLLAVGAALGVLAGACKPKPQGTPPLCSFRAATDAEIESKSLTPQAWLPIISPAIDRATLVRKGAFKDACGRPLEAEPAVFVGCPPDPGARVVSRVGDPVALDDLVLGQVGPGRMLAWAATDHLADGDAFGPAALVFWTDSGLDIHATGVVRGIAKGARLRLHHSGGRPVMIIDADRCGADGQCVSEIGFVPIVARKFRDVPLHDEEGACLGRARFELARRLDQPRAGAFTRRFELQRTIELAEEGIVIIDLVTGDEFDPADPTGTVRPFRRVSTRRNLEFDGERFVVRDKDLWTHVLRDYGLVRGDGEDSRERSDPDGTDDDEGVVHIEKTTKSKSRGSR